jgi:hypothetical protein
MQTEYFSARLNVGNSRFASADVTPNCSSVCHDLKLALDKKYTLFVLFRFFWRVAV